MLRISRKIMLNSVSLEAALLFYIPVLYSLNIENTISFVCKEFCVIDTEALKRLFHKTTYCTIFL